jgi:hypothetical protein
MRDPPVRRGGPSRRAWVAARIEPDVMQRYGNMKKRSVLATANPRRVTVGWDVLFGLRSQQVLT